MMPLIMWEAQLGWYVLIKCLAEKIKRNKRSEDLRIRRSPENIPGSICFLLTYAFVQQNSLQYYLGFHMLFLELKSSTTQ